MRWVRPTRADLVLVAVLTGFGIVSVLVTGPSKASGVDRGADAAAVVLALLSTAPLILRRGAPFPVLAVTSAAVVAAAARGYPVAAAGLGPIFAATSMAYLTNRRGALVAGAVLAVAALVATVVAPRSDSGEAVQLGTVLLIVGFATLAGDVLRTLHERNRQLEMLRDIEAREAVARDRVRIAREVHDVVGHALAGIALQARAGQRLLGRDPEGVRDALGVIDELATRALDETRAAIGRVRGSEEAAELRPSPRLADLDELIGVLQEDDLRVRLQRAGDETEVPATVQASAYRIVQEALSNVVKHARPATAEVTVAIAAGTLELVISDDGRRPPADDGGGHGLRGMRERAEQCGGSLEAGPDRSGGWRVHARLPIVARSA